jgi:hypothetical protein
MADDDEGSRLETVDAGTTTSTVAAVAAVAAVRGAADRRRSPRGSLAVVTAGDGVRADD